MSDAQFHKHIKWSQNSFIFHKFEAQILQIFLARASGARVRPILSCGWVRAQKQAVRESVILEGSQTDASCGQVSCFQQKMYAFLRCFFASGLLLKWCSCWR